MSAQLNPAQREAIRYLDGPCLVIAGAGSGKTRVITHKIMHLVESGIAPEAIGAITFTNKAAREMSDRLDAMHRFAPGRRPTVCTFHALGLQILREEGARVGLKRSFSILDADDSAGILASALATTDRKLIRSAQSRISLWKNALAQPDEAIAAAQSAAEASLARAWREHAATLSAYQAVDFDDLIGLPVRLFEEHPDGLQAWRARLRYLLIDEYQDTNAAQYRLLQLLVGPRGAFTAVGDDDQSIYGWRGATLDNLARLERDFPNLKRIMLEQNYRSSRSILEAANRLIERNPKLHPKRLWSDLGTGDPLVVVPCEDEEAEAESVVMRIQAHRFERRSAWRDYAILYRSNHQARVIEQALRKENIAYTLSGGQSFFERAEIRDLLAWLRLIANDEDDPALIRAVTTPKRGVGPATLTALGQYAGERRQSMFAAMFETGFESRVAARQLVPLREWGDFVNRIVWRAAREPAAQVLDDLMAAIDYRAWLAETCDERTAATRWGHVGEFLDWLKKRAQADGSTLAQLAQSIAVLAQLDRRDDEADAVRLMTIHASKGLEFAHVFIVGCEEGLLPHLGSLDDEPAGSSSNEPSGSGPREAGLSSATAALQRIEEERRLMYVAVTRAQRSLTLSWCRNRKRARETVPREPSRFMGEMALSSHAAQAVTVSRASGKEKLGALRALLASKAGPPTG